MTDSKPISITPYLDVLYRHRLTVFCVLAVGLGATFCLMTMLPNVYRSTAVIMVEPPQVAPGYVDVSAGAPGHAQRQDVGDQLETLARKAFSEKKLEQLIGKFGLYRLRPGEPLEPVIAHMRRHIELTVPQDAIAYESAHAQARTPDVLQISFEYGDPVTAQRVTAELADSYIDEGYQDRIQRADDAVRFLQTQVAQARAKLDQKGGQIQDLKRRYAGSLPEELQANVAQLDRLQEQLNMINQQLLSARAAPMMGGGQAVALSPEQQLSMLEIQLTQLRSEYSDQYPDVILLKAQIANLKQQIPADGHETKSHSGADSGLASDVGAASAGLQHQAMAVTAQMNALQTRISATPVHEQELAGLTRDYDALQTEYHGLLSNELAAQIHENLEKRHQDERLRLLEAADLPRVPERPNRGAIAILGPVFSLTLALAIPFGLFFTDTSFKDPDELQTEYGIPVAATIPAIEVPGERRMATIRAVLASCAGILVIAATIWVYANMVF